MIFNNLLDFENQLRRALVKLPVGQSASYLADLELVGMNAGFALIRLARSGRMADRVFQTWIETDLRPALESTFENLGESVRGIRFFYR
jgi:hypothetical protein